MVSANFGALQGDEPTLSSDRVIGRAMALKEIATENTIMLSDDEGTLAGLIKRNNATNTDQKNADQAEKKRRRSDNFNTLLLALEADRQALLRDLGDLQDRARELGERLEEIERDMGDSRETLDAIDDAIEYRREHGEFELNDDGSLKDDRVEELLKAYEEKHGPVDRSDPEAVQDALEDMREREVIRLRELEKEHVKTREELDYTFDEMEKKREELDLKEDEIEIAKEQAGLKANDILAEEAPELDTAKLDEFSFDAPGASDSFNAAAQDNPVEPSIESEPQEPQPLQEDGPVIQPM